VERFGRYRVVKELGAGAMGAVYQAHDETLGRDVAVKTVRTAGVGGLAVGMFQKRFFQEARAASAVDHPSVVRIFDMGVEGETPYLVMELLPGRSLKARLDADGPLPPAEARALGVQMARALEAAHAHGIVHRDVKPANVIEAGPGTWKLADFGVASVPDSSLTLSGQFLGSPAYAAPEALDRGAFGPASDVYGLGATLYHALTGQTPWGERSLVSLAVVANREDPPAPRTHRADLPADLDAVIMRALARDPTARPRAAELAELLSSCAGAVPRLRPAAVPPPPVPWRRRGLVAGVALLTALVVGAAIGASGSSLSPTPAPVPLPGLVPSAPAELGRGRGASGKREKHWRKVQEKLARGDLAGAEEKLEELLAKDPSDAEARALLERVRTERALAGSRGDD
jgi:serine/threonine-protein kinase